MCISTEPMRFPLSLTNRDLENAALTIAVKETEHRPLMQKYFPAWEHEIEYWAVHDLDYATADEALPMLKQHVDELIERLSMADISKTCPSCGERNDGDAKFCDGCGNRFETKAK